MKKIKIIDTAACFHGNFSGDTLIFNPEKHTATCNQCGETFTIIDAEKFDISEVCDAKEMLSDFINSLKIMVIANKMDSSDLVAVAKMADALDALDIGKMKEICSNYTTKTIPKNNMQMPEFFNGLNPSTMLMKGLSEEVQKMMSEDTSAPKETKEKKTTAKK